MFYWFCYYFLIFLTYAIIGWLWEVFICSIIRKKFSLNRGFLIGPYCPIYGVGGLAAIFVLQRYDKDPLVLFLFAVVGASVLEYVTSYIMEKLFNARWWDYSKEPFNVEGRICLKNSILFGLAGMLCVYIINPWYSHLLSYISPFWLKFLASILFLIFLIDCIISFSVMSKLKRQTRILKDQSEEMKKLVRQELGKNPVFLKRLLNAFPTVHSNYGDAIIDTLKKAINNLGKQAEKIRTYSKEKSQQKKN